VSKPRTTTMERVYGALSEQNRKHASLYGLSAPRRESGEAIKKKLEREPTSTRKRKECQTP
jgi:hypothetical protein